jgi:LPXTG-site transpeptidase (sortase) family protein
LLSVGFHEVGKFKNYRVLVILIVCILLSIPSLVYARPLRATAPVMLGSAENFAVLAASAISDTGLSAVVGDVGLSPTGGTAITGLTCAEVTGTIYDTNGGYAGGGGGSMACSVADSILLAAAKSDLSIAFADAVARLAILIPTQLGGTTVPDGVYESASGTFEIMGAGTLTLDGGGDPNSVFIFQMASTLVTFSNSNVVLTNGAQACNVFWQVGSSATIGTNSTFVGTIMADQSITDNGGSEIDGRFLAMNAAVTLNNTTITRPLCAVPTSTPTNTLTPSETATPSSTPTQTPSLTSMPSNTLSPSVTLNPSSTPTPTPSLTSTPTSSATPTSTLTASSTATSTPPQLGLLPLAINNTPIANAAALNTAGLLLLSELFANNTSLPNAGFAPVNAREFVEVPSDNILTSLDLILEIPSLNIILDIVGVPFVDSDWNISGLESDQAGYLYGTAFPTLGGNSVLAGHVWNFDNTPGPFNGLHELEVGDTVKIQAFGFTYIYEVQENDLKLRSDLGALQHSQHTMITLVTCETYDAASGAYLYYRVVEAALMKFSSD